MAAGLEGDYQKAMVRFDDEMGMLASAEQKIDRDLDTIIDLYRNEGLTITEFKERKAVLDHKREGLTTAKSDLSSKLATHEQAIAQKETIDELVSILEEGLPLLTTNTSYEDKLRVLDALKITVVYQPDGTVDVSGIISDALCDLTPTSTSAHVEDTEVRLRKKEVVLFY